MGAESIAVSVPVPIRQLQGFERIHLEPGEKKSITFTPEPWQLSLITDDGLRVVGPGEFLIAIGDGQPGYENLAGHGAAVLTRTLEVTGQVTEVVDAL